MENVVQTYFKDCVMYRNNEEIYIYHKGLLVAFSNKISDNYHQIFLTGRYSKRTRVKIATLLSYTFDGITQDLIDNYVLGSYFTRKFNYKGGVGKCFMNKYQWTI